MTGNEIRKEMISARDEFIRIIKAELHGPGSEFSIPDADHELISTAPTSRYSIGILYPQGNYMHQDNDEIVPVAETEEETEVDENSDESAISDDGTNEAPRIHRELEEDNTASESENLDEEISMAAQYKPSSMGVTFLARGQMDCLKVSVSFATYRKAKITDCIIPYMPENADTYVVPSELSYFMVYDNNIHAFKLITSVTGKEVREILERDTLPESEYHFLKDIAYRFVDYCTNGYVRVPHLIEELPLYFNENDVCDDPANTKLDGSTAKLIALRRNLYDNVWSVTVMLVNDLVENPEKPYHCIFQSRISINTENNDFIFLENNSSAAVEALDEEEQSLDLLYRKKKIYGTGLGTAVDWRISVTGEGTLWSDFMPTYEVPAMNFSLPKNDILSDQELSMKYLSDLDDTPKASKMNSLRNLVGLYKQWVDSLVDVTTTLNDRYKSAANKNISECVRAYERMYAGIETLEKNDIAYQAFMLANRAMFMQRIHIVMQSDMAKENADRYPGDAEISNRLIDMDYYQEEDNNCRWRPFQIAFLLMDVNSIVHDDSSDRNIVDLIWFPTGGGKTEAYLGLTAFTIFYRKLAYPTQSNGTSVIMRYTLRLLAAQQFTRAATLICACEYIRKDATSRRHKYPAYPLGRETISIGLWIGGTHIPNNNDGKDGAAYHVDKLRGVTAPYYVRNVKEKHNKFQVLKCPWCGTKMVCDDKDGKLVGEWGYSMQDGKHFYMNCPHEDCDFTDQLPIQIIDEELYRKPPTLLFGTVDKFAMLPWDGRIGSFFGVGMGNRAPELIIQDELHLISGALGTIVGLFETAIDAICSQKGIAPKIIASTATIRRAKEQCSVLYNRDIVQFPAPGLDSDDSFFAREAKIDYERGIYGRKYVGIMPSGKTKAMTEIRAMAAMLQKTYTMDIPDEVKDKFWTLTSYYNSLKDLGKASTMVDDDVKDFIIRTSNRMFSERRNIGSADELTSRVSTTELNETLDKLEKIEYSKENRESKKYASNVLLATNMISVGIDVARLNVMLMVGQPKLTSEYIQASSRVGRSYPGVAFVQYDATKSRDRSHYERFKAYHESFYKFVEPTGATPFSKPARERALHSVLISMFRNKCGLSQENDAIHFDYEYHATEIKEIEDYIISRMNGINARAEGQAKDDVAAVRSEIRDFFNKWQNYVHECLEGTPPQQLSFGRKFMVYPPSDGERRLLRQYHSQGKDIAIETLTSMRNVDTPVTGSVIIWEENHA